MKPRTDDRVKKVHFPLQGKGGVGKSLVASLLVQNLLEKSMPVIGIDADPVNATLSSHPALKAQRLELMEGSTLVEKRFDGMMEQILTTDSHFVIDAGAPAFLPLTNYLIENKAIQLIEENSKQVVVHVVLTGGQAMLDTFNGLAQLAEQLPEQTDLVVWLNEYFGDISADGKRFEEMRVYNTHRDRISAIVRLARQTSSTFGADVREMLERKVTFREVEQGEQFGLMARHRLASVKRAIFEQLALVV